MGFAHHKHEGAIGPRDGHQDWSSYPTKLCAYAQSGGENNNLVVVGCPHLTTALSKITQWDCGIYMLL